MDNSTYIHVSWNKNSMKAEDVAGMSFFRIFIKTILELSFWATLIFGVWWHNVPIKRITPLFLLRRQTIWQSVNKQGRKIIRSHRQKYHGKSLQVKLFGVARFFRPQLQQVLEALPYEEKFRVCTHLKRSFEKAEKQGEITIYQIFPKRKRLLTECIILLGVKDFFRLLFTPEKEMLFKKFYKIIFTRNQ